MSELQNKTSTQDNKYFKHPCLDPRSNKCTADEYFKEIAYQIDLQEYVNIWAICNQYFIYQVEEDESAPGQGVLTIVNFEKEQHTVKIQNFTRNLTSKQQNFNLHNSIEHISYNSGVLIEASDNQFQAIMLNETVFDNNFTTINALNQKIRKVSTDVKIQALFILEPCRNKNFSYICFETDDAILDFNRIFLTNIDSEDDSLFSYSFEQIGEINHRGTCINDPIVKIVMVFIKTFNYTIAQRASGGVDLYWNLRMKDTIEKNLVSDIAISLTSLYFKMQDGTYKYFDHNSNEDISFDQAVEISNDQLKFDQIHVRIVQNIVKIYSGMNMVHNKDTGKTLYLISHGKFLSVFDIDYMTWINHLQFEEEIFAIFKNKVSILQDDNIVDNRILQEDSDDNYISDFQVILTNGDIHQQILEIYEQNEIVSSERCKIRLQGKVLRLSEDIILNRSIFIVFKQENQDICLKQIRNDKAYDVQIPNPLKNLNAIQYQFRDKQLAYVLIQNGIKLSLYKLILNKEGPGQLNLQLLHQLNGGDTVTGTIHAITSYDIENHLIVVDELNMYVYKILEATWKIYSKQYCTGLSYFDKNTSYMICQQNRRSINPGLRMLDMEALISKDRLVAPLLKDVQIGARVNFYYDYVFARLSFIQSITNALIFPVLHWNQFNFMGYQGQGNYLCYKVIGDKFIALQSNGVLQSWDMISAKLHEKIQLEVNDYSGYSLHSTNRMDAVLLSSNYLKLMVHYKSYSDFN
ncbi:UNKNOWN [Stylonychia lemnae]|uniref:Uncharacterized protein n=1 Tax=Stylonychia lemnae TaxID=5949 RepID=A0A077ZSY4_STYLE|nr:UNKNOWN [Stylonychia lemnae]|eukprot:CDW72998.1 UNKNOWN [Stylonychia lemnae]